MLPVCKRSCRALWLKSLMSFLTSCFLRHQSYFSASPQVFFLAPSEVLIHLAKQQKFPTDESFTNYLSWSVGAATDFSIKLVQNIGGRGERGAGESGGGFDSGRNANAEVKKRGLIVLKMRLQHETDELPPK